MFVSQIVVYHGIFPAKESFHVIPPLAEHCACSWAARTSALLCGLFATTKTQWIDNECRCPTIFNQIRCCSPNVIYNLEIVSGITVQSEMKCIFCVNNNT